MGQYKRIQNKLPLDIIQKKLGAVFCHSSNNLGDYNSSTECILNSQYFYRFWRLHSPLDIFTTKRTKPVLILRRSEAAQSLLDLTVKPFYGLDSESLRGY